jgi:lysophospholipase L1-like esterase
MKKKLTIQYVEKFLLIVLLFGIFRVAGFAAEIQTEMQNSKIVFLGNILVKNYNWDDDFEQYKVYNTGISDFTSQQLSWVLSHSLVNYKPKYCLIYSGLEDILLEVPHERIVYNYRYLCDQLKEADIISIINSTICLENDQKINRKIQVLNKDLKNYCYSSRIEFIDINESLKNSNIEVWQKGLNLTDKAYQIWVREISNSLNKLEEQASRKLNINYERLAKERITRIMQESPENVNIVMLGNSITEEGGDWNEKLGRNNVRNAGQGGYTTGQMLWYIDTCVVQANPQACFVLGGINDLTLKIPVEKIYKNHLQIISILKSNDIIPIVQSTVYQKDNIEGNKNVKKLNSKLESYCQKHNIHFIDLNEHLSENERLIGKYTTDGTHFTQEGYEVWSKVIKQFIKEHESLFNKG